VNAFVALIVELLISAAVVGYETKAHPLDPIYSTCAEATAHGYGPYTTTDPEYKHYRDGDKDGRVCE
jgi:hypothetical protein